MKNLYLSVKLLLFIALFNTSVNAQNLNITPGQTPQQLVNNLVGAGVNATNISGQLAPAGSGSFVNNGINGLTLTSGIVLSTGNVMQLPFVGFHASTDLGFPGDTDLNAIVAPMLTEDVSKIEFDFTAANDSVEFFFVFGSEEYNEYVNSNFNDVFAFIINGPGYAPNTNVALIPGTTTPISINTVNNGNANGTATGPCMNCSYYIDNFVTTAVDMALDGYTVAIRIKFPIWPCSNYHFKIAIGDVADGIFDSSVMLEENSFVACPNMQATQHGIPVNSAVTICAGGSATLTAPHGASYAWSTGETTQSIIVTQPGSYNFVITDPSQTSCFSFSDNITVVQQGAIQTPVISQNGASLSAPNITPSPGITYQWSMGGNPISGATQSTLLTTGNGCYTLTIYEGSCESTSNTICITNTSIYEIAESAIHIYPNPVNGVATIDTPFEAGTVSTLHLLDLTGRNVRPASVQQGKSLTIEKQNLPAGVYFLEISNTGYQGTIKKKIIFQ